MKKYPTLYARTSTGAVQEWYQEQDGNRYRTVSGQQNGLINGEWRFIVSKEDGIIAGSTYAFQGQLTKIPSCPEGATEKCLEVWKEGYHPDSVYTIDIAQDADGKFWLLELNSFSSAGIYACDPKMVIEGVSRIAEQEWDKANNMGVY